MWDWFKGKEEPNFVSEISRISTLFVILFLRISNLFLKKLIFKWAIKIWLGFWDLATLSLPKFLSWEWERSHAYEHFCCSEKVLSRFSFLCFTKIKVFIRRTTRYLSSPFETFNFLIKLTASLPVLVSFRCKPPGFRTVTKMFEL